MKQYWLMKTEPDEFSITDLERVRVESWNGVRSMFARFHMRNMSVDDDVLFYHSSVNPPGVAGLARVVRTRVVDETQFDPDSKYFDEKATREKPIWDCVDVEYVRALPYFVSINRIRADAALADMVVLRQGRLSVQPVKEHEFTRIVELGNEPPPPDIDKKKPAPKKQKPKQKPKKPVAKKTKKQPAKRKR